MSIQLRSVPSLPTPPRNEDDLIRWAKDLHKAITQNQTELYRVLEILCTHRVISGSLTDRPDPEDTGNLYCDTGTGVLYIDSGTWVEISPTTFTTSGLTGTIPTSSLEGDIDADTLNGTDQYVRKDVNDTLSAKASVSSGGEIELDAGSTLDANGAVEFDGATSLALPATGITGAGHGSGNDADTLDGEEGASYCRTDEDTTFVGGTLKKFEIASESNIEITGVLKAFGTLLLGTGVQVSESSNVVDISGEENIVYVVSAGSGVTADVATITPPSGEVPVAVFVVYPGHTITFKDGTGNLLIGGDFACVGNNGDVYAAMYSGSNWYTLIARNN